MKKCVTARYIAGSIRDRFHKVCALRADLTLWIFVAFIGAENAVVPIRAQGAYPLELSDNLRNEQPN